MKIKDVPTGLCQELNCATLNGSRYPWCGASYGEGEDCVHPDVDEQKVREWLKRNPKSKAL